MADRRNIPIPDDVWEDVKERVSAGAAPSASAYVREAVIARIYYERALEGDRALARALGLAKRRR